MLAKLLRLPADHRRRRSPDIRLEPKLRLTLLSTIPVILPLSLSPKVRPAMMSIESVWVASSVLPMLAKLLRLPADRISMSIPFKVVSD